MSRAGGPPGISSAARVVGWNWKNSRSRTAAPARQARAKAVGGGDGRIAGAGKQTAGTPGGEEDGVGSQLLGPAAGQVRHSGDPGRRRRRAAGAGQGSRQSARFREEVGDERAGLHPEPALDRAFQDGTFQDGGDEPAGDAGARRVPAGMQDPRRRMGGFEAQGRSAVGTHVELHAVAGQAGDVPDSLRAQDTDGLGVVQPGAGGKGVGDVGRHGVPGGGVLRRQDGGDAALGVERVALLQRPLAQQDHLDVTAAVSGGVGGEQRGVEPGNPAADNHEPPGHGRAASMRSRATFAGAATSSAHRDAVDHLAPDERLEHPGEVAGVDAVHRRAGADHRVEAEDGVLRVLARPAG